MMAGLSLDSSAKAQQDSLHWVDARGGDVPYGAIVGGSETGRTLYVCRGWYNNGLHPGKVVGSNCNIGWGGDEVLLDRYQVLVGDQNRVQWVDASNGDVPPHAFSGGYEPGRPDLYVCRALYNGIHPGKIVGSNCNIGYGGKEITLNRYQVMVVE
jgi:hypothetical protein